MNRTLRRLLVGAVVGALALTTLGVAGAAAQTDEEYKVLVVGKTLGFRHASIVDATQAIIALGAANGFTVDVWDPPNDSGGWWGSGSPGQPELTLETTPFTSAADLAQYATIVFVSTVDNTNALDPATPTLLDASELAAFQGYIRGGGGFAGIHAATDSMHTVPWYGQLTGGGARFLNHPAIQPAVKIVEDPTHPSTEMLPAEWARVDEWYNFTQNPREDVRVLLNLDESTYNAGSGAMGDDHPIAWCHNFEGGRSWYTAGGHTRESFSEPLFLEHLLGGIEWSAGVVSGGGDCVTFAEVSGLVDDLSDAHARSRAAAKNVTRHLDRAEASADEGDRRAAVRQLRTAANLARALVPDRQSSAVLVDKIEDLSTWQRNLADSGR